jgi:hypothetical protein
MLPVAILAMAGCLMLLLAAGHASPPQSKQNGSASTTPAFTVGEELIYTVEWDPPLWLLLLPKMEAGQATLNLAEETQYQNRRAYRIIFKANSSGMLVRLLHLEIDDYYEFVSDADTLCTYSVMKREREGKRKRDIQIAYAADESKLHLREVDVALGVVLRDRDYTGIPPCVKDLFSALYALRRNRLDNGSKQRILVGDNQTVKEVEVNVEKKERVVTPTGIYNTLRINTVAVMGGLFKNGGQFRIWLTDDSRQMPVKFEIKVNLGKVMGSLKEIKSSRDPNSRSGEE